MKWSIKQKIRIGFGLALALLLAIGAVSYRSATRSAETFRWVDHADRVLDQLNQTLVAMLNVETAARGYALTGKELFLEPYQPGLAAIQKGIGTVRDLTADNPLQQQRLDVLEPLIVREIESGRNLVEQRKADGLDAVARRAGMAEGKELMDRVRKAIEEMERTERELLRERSVKAQREARATVAIMILGSVMAMFFVAGASTIVHRDLRARQRAEEERDRFFTLSLDMLCIAGFDGYFKRLNPAWEKTLGFTREELLARPYLDFIHPEDRPATLAEAQKIATGAASISFENRYRCQDGSYRWFLWSATPSLNTQMIYAAARDITERKQVDERIRKLNQDLEHQAAELESANKELEAFSYSVSHDLRAPVRHTVGFLQLLQKHAGPTLDGKSERYLKMISESAEQMGRLIDDLLAFSLTSRAEMRTTRLDLKQLVQSVIAQARQETEGRAIVWKIASLPEVWADPSLLQQVMVNLISNALKYSRRRPRAEIEIGCQPDHNGEQVFFIRDNGVGFDMKYADKLFGVFQRLHEAEEFEGTGIGLANVHRIISRHGGRTWAEGVVDGGATFYFSLPKSEPIKL